MITCADQRTGVRCCYVSIIAMRNLCRLEPPGYARSTYNRFISIVHGTVHIIVRRRYISYMSQSKPCCCNLPDQCITVRSIPWAMWPSPRWHQALGGHLPCSSHAPRYNLRHGIVIVVACFIIQRHCQNSKRIPGSRVTVAR